MTQPCQRTVVIGIGNPERGDDAAGRLVAQRLQGKVPASVEVAEHEGEPASLLTLLEGAHRAFIVDACRSGAAPGTVRRFDVNAAPLPALSLRVSSHELGLTEALELARALGRLPPRCVVYAIEAATVTAGSTPSWGVRAAIGEVSERLRAELGDVCDP